MLLGLYGVGSFFYLFCFISVSFGLYVERGVGFDINFGVLKVDLDLGNYERFLDTTLTCDNNITTGKIYQVICYACSLFESCV